ncbi:heterokaryon incompatibility protein-domain-containing protein [Ustulina deusta]|nr:heterokaryon incompatibility protein-domain-containing protein [Ustulina deusta]
MDTFRYKQLDLNTSAFRLVRLVKGDSYETIECELIYTTLDDNVIPYEAVSYTWGGTSAKPLNIRLDGKRFMVTSSLWHLLGNIRDREKDRYLWVDAIAINQDDNFERSHQVQRMRAIYRSADHVIIYLGAEATLPGIFMESLRRFHIHTLGCHWASDDRRWKIAWEMAQDDPQLDYSATPRDVQRKGLEELLERPWFRRVWILQEVANARSASVYCGTTSIPAHIFAMAPTFLGVDLDGHTAAVFGLMPTYSGQGSRKLRDGTFCSILLDFRQSEASDPRDRIFALLGLCKDQDAEKTIVPDYTQNQGEVICATLKHILGRYPNQDWGIITIEEFLSDRFLFNLTNIVSEDMGELFIHILSSCKPEVVRSFSSEMDGSINVTRRMLDAAASNKFNAVEMMILLLRLGELFDERLRRGQLFFEEFEETLQPERVEWGYTCIHFSHGEVRLLVQQEDLYPFLLFASKPFLGRLLLQLKAQDVRTADLIHKLQRSVDRESQNGLQKGIPDDPREDVVNYTQLSVSLAINRKEIIRVLLENWGNTVHPFEKWMRLFMAVLGGETEIVELLLEMNPGEFSTPWEVARFILSLAIDCRREPIVQWPCDPLSLALHHRDHDMVNLFHRYPMNVAAHWGATPLHFAVENQSETLLQLFLENGANPSAIDRNGRTALEKLKERYNKPVFCAYRRVQKTANSVNLMDSTRR